MNFHIVSCFFAIIAGSRPTVIFVVVVYMDVVDDGGTIVYGRSIRFVIPVHMGMIQIFSGKKYPI